MKRRIALILVLLLSLTSIVSASTTSELSDIQKQLSENQARQQELQQKINELQAEERSLQNQINYMDSQIALTNLKVTQALTKIAERQAELEGLSADIEELIARIGRIEESVKYQNEVYGQRLRARYKSSRVSAFEILFGADSLSDVFTRLKYLKMMEQQDRRLISQMNETQFNYKNQKKLLEETKKQVELVKQELEQEKRNLEARRAELDQQKAAKAHLLAVTKNDEKRFQDLLEIAQREREQIERAIVTLQQVGGSHRVERGELIGLMGNTGYSTGPHLHFGVYNISSLEEYDYYSSYDNPLDYLKPMEVEWETCPNCNLDACFLERKTAGSGSWDWPMHDPKISQGYGTTCWSNRLYGGREHPAIDVYSTDELAVAAVEEGEAYFYRGGQEDGNGVFIFHPNGKMTLYWHLK